MGAGRRDGRKVGIIVTGSLTYRAMLVAKELETKGIKTKVMNLASIEPIDVEAIVALAKETESNRDRRGASSKREAWVQLWRKFSRKIIPVPMEFIGTK